MDDRERAWPGFYGLVDALHRNLASNPRLDSLSNEEQRTMANDLAIVALHTLDQEQL